MNSILADDGRVKRESVSFVKQSGSGRSLRPASSTMSGFEAYDSVTSGLQKPCYNANYNTRYVRNTSVSRLLKYVQHKRLTDSLEILGRLGYDEVDALVVLAGIQTLQAFGGVV